MTRPIFLLCVMPLVAACEYGRPEPLRLPTQPAVSLPAPPPPSPPSPAIPRQIFVGEEVSYTFVGGEIAFVVTAPRDGTLVATLNWDVRDSLLVLVMQGIEFKPVPPQWSPVAGRLKVVAGQTYRLSITPGGTDWWYDDKFVLTTILE